MTVEDHKHFKIYQLRSDELESLKRRHERAVACSASAEEIAFWKKKFEGAQIAFDKVAAEIG